jgi:hypothetical protein
VFCTLLYLIVLTSGGIPGESGRQDPAREGGGEVGEGGAARPVRHQQAAGLCLAGGSRGPRHIRRHGGGPTCAGVGLSFLKEHKILLSADILSMTIRTLPFPAVLRIHDILVWIQIRGSMPLNNGSGFGSGSCYFCH